MGSVHADIVRKLCCEMICVFKDIGVDILTLGPIVGDSDTPFDYGGVDFHATTVLTGMLYWLTKLQEDWTLQPWYESFREFLQLLQGQVFSSTSTGHLV
jgi:hypothetical protein